MSMRRPQFDEPTPQSNLAVWLVGGLIAAIGAFGSATSAVAAEQKKERKVDVYEAEQKRERPSLKTEGEGAKDFKTEEFIEEKNFESVKKQDEAIVRLQDLLESTPEDDPKRAEILFNLSEMYWDKSKYYEMSAFRKQDECYELKDAGETGRAQACQRQMDQMLEESKRQRAEAVELYKQILRNHPNFKNLDRVLFYLGTNLQEVGRHEEAIEIFKKLLSDFPDTKYTPNVLLAIGEYFFNQKKNPERALKFYQKVGEFEDSNVYSYARYKAGWCYFNMEQKDRSLDVFIDVIDYAKAHPQQPNAKALVSQARKDIVLTYSFIGSPQKAIPFFEDLTGGDTEIVRQMTERLAVQYADKSKFAASNTMYRKLIQRNRSSTRTLEYQYEIVRNHSSQSAYSKDTLEEIIKLMKLVQYAEEGKFEDYDKETFKETWTQAEQLVRQWATRYHREAQVTKSDGLYKMAYYLYSNYLETFEDSEHIYKMTFFNGEILYYLESWKRAAKAYDRVLEIDDEGEWTKEAAHGQVLAYFNLINTSEERANLEDPLRFENRDKVQEVQEGGSEEDDPIPEKKEIADLKKQLIEACKDYVEYVPDGERIVDVKYTMARVYYEHNHLKKAVEYFENIAFNHPDHRLGVIAANLHLDSLNLLNDFKTLGKAVRRYQNEQPIDDEEFSSTVAKLDEAISFKLCRQHEDNDRWREAANCYVEFYRRFDNSDYVDEALYNAALAFERIKELGKAIQVRIFLLKARPGSPYAPETLFNIGANYHALAVYSKAANFYEQFVKNFPDHEKAQEALANAATFRQGLGQYDRAISDFEKFLELFGDDPEYDKKVADVAFQIAKILEKQDKGWEALEQYREYVDTYADKGTLDRLLQAHSNIGMFFWNHDDRDQALLEFERTLEVYNDLSDEQRTSLSDGRDAAARAKFMRGEDVYQEMAEITVESSNEEELQRRFKDKLEVAQKAQKIYEEVIKFRRPDWAIAALFKIGAQYQNFAETVRNSPVPERLNYNQKEIYRGLLEDRASMVEAKAVDAYKRALSVAKKESWFNEYSRKAEVRLADLRPGEFRKPSELRARPTYLVAGFTEAGFMDELQEEERRLDDLGSGEPEAESVERQTAPTDAKQDPKKSEAESTDTDKSSAGGTS